MKNRLIFCSLLVSSLFVTSNAQPTRADAGTPTAMIKGAAQRDKKPKPTPAPKPPRPKPGPRDGGEDE